MFNDVLHNLGAYTNWYSILIRHFCVLENGSMSECYTGIFTNFPTDLYFSDLKNSYHFLVNFDKSNVTFEMRTFVLNANKNV